MLLNNVSSVLEKALGTDEQFSGDDRPLLETVILASVLLLLILACVIGNVFVIVAIFIERDLRGRPQYYLIFSLAVADLIVGLIVTPLGAWNTVTGAWKLGVVLCDFWISVDVLVCTASILHLVAIALDRYWSVTDISYVQNRTPRRITLMLAVIWLTSLLISLAPFAGWKDDGFGDRVEKQHVCLISQAISYQVFSTATAFYIPLIAIIGVYWKIMRAAKKRFKRERDRRTVIRPPPDVVDDKKAPLINKKNKKIPLPPAVVITDINRNGVSATTPSDGRNGTVKHNHHHNHHRPDSSSSTQSEEERTATVTHENTQETKLDSNDAKRSSSGGLMKRKRRPKETPENQRERKAWRTLAIITGTFVACWTPFFLVSLYRPICGCSIPPVVEQVTSWLGYLNSALNPIIYTVFSQDFRTAFKKIVKRLCLITEY
ncbi:unnamed protein product [Caenorhabditis auriculariae]|uniref:G-protein coupled receptors family 1 profile domain-containing protein n=1 Tax=Caenorhabditis auriculariae TaxID=2777116 RepID=A0A8S1HP43_9PELO|nr:unnamed protein product [Caenorhabditis auriculariae]